MESNNPLVSIVLPVWNGEKYLSQAIESIKNQTFSDFELIIINDCSSDSSLSIASSFANGDSRIRVFSNTTNTKLPASLNKGFEQAKGKYFTWTSDDNLLHKNFLATLLHNLKSSGADIVYAPFRSIDEEGRVLGISPAGNSEELILMNTIGASFLYKREVHEKIGGFDTKKFLYEDYDFWVRAYLHGFKYYKTDQIVYDYRRHGGSLTSKAKFPSHYLEYRYSLRNQFKSVTRDLAFKARSTLALGYRRDLGYRRWAILVLESFALKPYPTLQMIRSQFGRLLQKRLN